MTPVCPVCQSPVEPTDQVCPSCSFHLSGSTQRFQPVGSAKATPEVQKSAEDATLRMVRGPQVGAVYSLNAPQTTIGRNPQCDIFLNDMTVSRDHAVILRQADALIINDENSFNGVWVNNRTVTHHALRPGDYIQIGKYDFVYEEGKGGDSLGR